MTYAEQVAQTIKAEYASKCADYRYENDAALDSTGHVYMTSPKEQELQNQLYSFEGYPCDSASSLDAEIRMYEAMELAK